ncbi:MAG: riboflavin synthase [Eubacterium sp.]
MFTGIIEEVGTLYHIKKGVDSAILTISGQVIFSDLHLGDSVAVNGVCLTVTGFSNNRFTADVMHETLNCSSLGSLKIGSAVNLERAMPVNGRFGGHIVSGHIDGIGQITAIKKDSNAVWYTVTAEDKLLKYSVPKGSIAIDGISLTVASVTQKSLSVSIIPHTIKSTAFSKKGIGDTVNLENDMIGKYVEKLMYSSEKSQNESKITSEFLMKSGY